MIKSKTGQELWERAKKIIPTGNQLLSKRAELFLPEQWPAYYKRARGCSVWDLDDQHYYDFAQMGVGTCVLGYADTDVNAAVKAAIRDGSMTTLNAPEEVELAELMVGLHPWSDMVRFARTGGEACAIAIRIARAFTGKSRVLFCGYHGWHDWYISSNVADADNLTDQLLPGLHPNGVPKELSGTAIPFFYNNLLSFEKCLDENYNEIACIIMEPRRSVEPEGGFLKTIREKADKLGAILIFDEITSGFRVNAGGVHLTYGVEPDIAVFGKAMGNGFPISAVIGRRDIMQVAADSFISSTFWTERIGFVAAIATLKKYIKNSVHEKLKEYGAAVNSIWSEAANKNNIDISIDGMLPLTHITFNSNDSSVVQTLFTQEMLTAGFLQGAAVYTSFAYSELVLDQYRMAVNRVFEKLSLWTSTGAMVEQYLKGPVRITTFSRLT